MPWPTKVASFEIELKLCAATPTDVTEIDTTSWLQFPDRKAGRCLFFSLGICYSHVIPSILFEVELLILKLHTLQIDEHVESHISIQDSKAIVVIIIITIDVYIC